jgi:hypothetical protein
MAKKLGIGGPAKVKSVKKPVNQGYESAAHGGMGDKRGFSNLPIGNYSGNPAPRVGGPAPKPSGLKGAKKSHIKAAKSMVRPGTGSGASKQAKRRGY